MREGKGYRERYPSRRESKSGTIWSKPDEFSKSGPEQQERERGTWAWIQSRRRQRRILRAHSSERIGEQCHQRIAVDSGRERHDSKLENALKRAEVLYIYATLVTKQDTGLSASLVGWVLYLDTKNMRRARSLQNNGYVMYTFWGTQTNSYSTATRRTC